MKKKYWIILVVVLLGASIGAWFIFKKEKTTAFEWRTAKVERGDLKIVVTATGSLSAVTTIQVGTQVSGIISRILVDFNSVVKEGQVIALLDTTYLAQAVEDASASLQRAEIQVNQTKRDYDRTKTLFEQKVVAQADYDLALSNYETAVANARSSKSALKRAVINLRYATIYAPISGVVVARNVDVGQTVAASFSTPTLFSIANDLTKMQVQASIDEADIGKIKVGQDVFFTVDAYDDLTFTGIVSQIRLQPIVLQNVVKYTVIINVPNPDLKLMPGMTANITVNIQEAKDILKVPASALRFNPPQEYLDKMMKEMPDSLKQKKGRGGQTQGQGTGQTFNRGAEKGSSDARAAGPGGSGPTGGTGTWGEVGSQHGPGHEGKWGKGSFGMLWIKEGDKITPLRVRTGLSDGSYTEIKGKISEGSEVIVGVLNTQAKKTQTQQSPFVPQRH